MRFPDKEPPPRGMTYRRLKVTADSVPIPELFNWHFRPDCSAWPLKNYFELDGEPLKGRLCVQCCERYVQQMRRSTTA